MFVTCLSIVVLDEIVVPRILASGTNGMSELPTRIEVSAMSGSVVPSDYLKR